MFGKSSRSRSQYESKQCQMITAGNDLKTIGAFAMFSCPWQSLLKAWPRKCEELLGKELAARL